MVLARACAGATVDGVLWASLSFSNFKSIKGCLCDFSNDFFFKKNNSYS
jgi:hypothetical protein